MTGRPGGPAPQAAVEELRLLYGEFDRGTARISPLCRASGRCCDFDAFGHTLFCSRFEAELLVAEAAPVRFDPASRLCPWWRDRRCEARGPRPLGCRAFFCDGTKADAMGELHEEFLRRLQSSLSRPGLRWTFGPGRRPLGEIAAGAGGGP